MITLAFIVAGVLVAALAVCLVMQHRRHSMPRKMRVRVRRKHTRQMTVPYYY